MSGVIVVGARVRVRKDRADRYIQPYRNWISAGRLATVIMEREPTHLRRRFTVRFDCKRTPRRQSDYDMDFSGEELELV